MYPNSPGHKASDTSREAAALMSGTVNALRVQALKAIADRPQTSWELAATLDVPFENVQPRTSELRKKGLIEDSGERGPARSPSTKAIVWRATRNAVN